MGAGGGVVVARFTDRTTRGCASVGIGANGKGATTFLPHCLEPGMAMVGGLVLVIGGGVLLLVGLWAMARSWSQRERSLGPDVLPPLERPARSDGAHPTPRSPVVGAGAAAAISPPPGWYAVPPTYEPMWWDGRAWATAPTLAAVREPAVAQTTTGAVG